jgi:L-lactate dehydrogenase (cytochrome)
MAVNFGWRARPMPSSPYINNFPSDLNTSSSHPPQIPSLEIFAWTGSCPRTTMSDTEPKLLNGNEVATHASKDSCWVIVSGKVYDVTQYLEKHPGGSQILLQYGGKDATAVYEPIHPRGTIERSLPKDKHLGSVDPATVSSPSKPQVTRDLDQQPRIPLAHCMNVDDIEKAATRIIPRSAYVYFSSAADSLGSLSNNHKDWKKVGLRPRIMRNVRRVDMTRTMLCQKFRLPFFCLARGAASWGIPYCPSTYSTVPHDELMDCLKATKSKVKFRNFAAHEGGQLWFQLYVAHEKERTIELVTMARNLGYKALVITVDTPVVGKREEDERYRAEVATASGDNTVLNEWYKPADEDDPNAPPLRGHHSSTLNWDDLPWIREAWTKGRNDAGPVILKGIQTAEDAALAVYTYNVDGIYLSNHGGRQCDDAPSSIRTLLEIRKFYPEILQKTEVYLDGGVRRGADIIKALCLGAKGVALGRPFMYAVSMGDEGVGKVIQRESVPGFLQPVSRAFWFITFPRRVTLSCFSVSHLFSRKLTLVCRSPLGRNRDHHALHGRHVARPAEPVLCKHQAPRTRGPG